MNNQIQVVLKSSTTEMSLNDHDSGIYIVPELNGLTGLPDIRTTSGVNAGYDGGWTSAQNYDARSITLRGVIANEDKATVERMRKQLVSLLGQGKNEELTLDIVTEAGSAYEIQVRTIACEMAMQRVLTQQEFMIQLRADDPLIYDNTEAGEPAIVQVQKALGGFQIPFEIPLAIGGGEDASVIDNHGLEQVAPIVKMYGALHNPKIINQTTNQYMQIEADLGYAEGAYTDAETSDSGQCISFDAPIAAPLADFSLKGNIEQTGTPTPDAPVAVRTVTGENTVKIRGKNLLKLPSAGTSGGITYSVNSDGTFNVHGTNNSGYEILFNLYLDSSEFQSVNYTLGAREVLPSGLGCRCEIFRGGTWKRAFVSVNSARQTQTGTPDFTDANRVRVAITVANGYTVNIDNVGIQLEKGSSASSFEPYQEQSYEANLGKNLFNPSVAAHPTGMPNNIGETLPVVPNTTYSFNVGDNRSFAQVQLFDSSDTRTRTLGNGANDHLLTFTTAASEVSALVCFYPGSSGVEPSTYDYTGVQFEIGQPTTYAAYFTPIELCKIGTYQDYIWKDDDTWKIHNAIGKITLDGSLDESIVSGGTATSGKVRFNVTVSGVANIGGSEVASYSNNFVGITRNDTWNCVQGVALGQNLVQIYCDATSGYNLDQFRTWLGSHNTTVYYPFSTPTDAAITNTTLIEQLDAILNSGRTYAGTNNITTVIAAGNSQGEVQVSYYTHQDPATRDEIVIDSRLRTITLNGLDIYDKKTEGSEFLMLAPGENKLMLQSDIDGDNGYAEVNYKQGYLSI